MGKDYRISFINDIEAELIRRYGPDQVAEISNIILKAMSGYEIMERCTDIIPMDDANQKLMKRYNACLMVDGKSEKTAYQYIRTCRKLSEALNKPFAEMGAYDIRFFLAMEKERGLSNRSLENTRANLSAFFQWLSNDEIIPKNPLATVKPIKYADEVRKPFSEVEIDALRGACKTLKERAMVEILISTGVRVSELTGMKTNDIDFSTLSVHVIHGKGAKERMTYTTSVSVKHLQRYLWNRKENGEYLFYNSNHKPLNAGGVRYILKELAKRAGVNNVHPHRFRRTFATGLARRGMEIQEIQRLLGHSNINTTLTYVCTDDTKVQASYKKYIA